MHILKLLFRIFVFIYCFSDTVRTGIRKNCNLVNVFLNYKAVYNYNFKHFYILCSCNS